MQGIQSTKVKEHEYLTERELYQFCLDEKEKIMDFVPEKSLLDYAIFNKSSHYMIVCVYRDILLFRYKLFMNTAKDQLQSWVPLIHKFICKIICERAKNHETVTFKEEKFLEHILDDNKPAECIEMIVNYSAFLSSEIQSKTRLMLKYLPFIKN